MQSTTSFDLSTFQPIFISKIQLLKGIFEDTQTNIAKLESGLLAINELLSQIKDITLFAVITNEDFRNFIDKVSSWILKNFSSIKLSAVLNLISNILSKYRYTPEIKKEEIMKILQLETYENLLNEKKEKINKEEILSADSLLTNSFLSALYALIVTISNKPDIIVKSKNLLRVIVTLLTQVCEIDNVAIYYKKRRLISIFCVILKELKASKDPTVQESLIAITKLLMYLFAKIGIKRPIYRDYMFKKSVPDKITDLFLLLFTKDMEIAKIFSLYCFFSVRTADHKTYYWTKGVCNVLIELLNKQMILTAGIDEGLIEYTTLVIYNLSIDNFDIQAELKEQNYLDLAKQLLVKFSSNNFVIFNVVSTLRRIKDQELSEKIAEELLYTFFALFDYYYLTVKKEVEELKVKDNSNLSSLSNKFQFIILKEIVAILGNIVKDETHSLPFIEKNLHLVLIDLKLSFISFPKLIKNTIGALINLTTSNEIREKISQVAAFIQSIYLVLDQYKDNQPIIDYELKLIINVMKNDTTIKTFISGDLFFYLFIFIKNYAMHDEIVFNCVKIIRTLILKKKGLEDFLVRVVEFYSALFEVTDVKDNVPFFSNFIDEMINLLSIKPDSVNICIEILLLISYLANQNETFKKLIESNQNFLNIIQKIISLYSQDETVSKLISQCIAQLPIEEFEQTGLQNK